MIAGQGAYDSAVHSESRARSWRDDLSLLREPGVALLFTGRTMNTFGIAFAPVALSFGILGLPGGNASMLSIVLAAEAIPLVLFLLVGGALADRLPRRHVIMASQLLATLAYGALAMLIGLGVSDVRLLAAAAVASGVGAAMGFPAFTGLIPQIIPPDRLQAGNALLAFGPAVARIVGVVASGAVTAIVGGAGGLAVSAVMFLLTALTAATLVPVTTPWREMWCRAFSVACGRVGGSSPAGPGYGSWLQPGRC